MTASRIGLGVALVLVAASCGGGSKDPLPPGRALLTEPRVEVLASDLSHLVLRIHFPAPTTERVLERRAEWTKVVVPGCESDSRPEGHPDVPHWGGIFAIPQGARARLVSARPTPLDVIPGMLHPSQPFAGEGSPDIDLYHDTQPPIALYRGAPFAYDDAAYRDPDAVPAQPAGVTGIGDYRDLLLGMLACACGSYDTAPAAYTAYDVMEVEIAFDGGGTEFLSPEGKGAFERSYPGHLLNRDALCRACQSRSTINLERVIAGEELLILTAPRFRPMADTLAAWKNGRGIPTSVREVADGMGPGPDTNTEIDAFLDDRYETAQVRFSYVLILGDADDVPTFVQQRINKDPGVMLATDFPYATYSTPPETHTFTPDFAVGRIPVDTEAQMDVVVQKIMTYEGTPPISLAFYAQAAVPAYFECCDVSPGIDGRQAPKGFINRSEWLYEQLQTAGYGMQRIYNTDTDHFAGEYLGDPTPMAWSDGTPLPAHLLPPYPWSGGKQEILDAFHAGRFLFVHLDHGSTNGWVDPRFVKSDVLELVNGDALPVALSLNCSSGGFDTTECFAERILHRDGGGVIGILAFTRMSNTKYFDSGMRGALGAFWGSTFPTWGDGTDRRRLGDALNNTRLVMAADHAGADPTADAWLNVVNHAWLYNLFGDPTLAIQTETPLDLPSDHEILAAPEWFDVVYGVEGALVTAYQMAGDGSVRPVGRGIVNGGSARLHHVQSLLPAIQVSFVASALDAPAVMLE